MQDGRTGREASEWGRETGPAIALTLGGEPLGDGSNAFRMDGRLLVIHCASPKTDQVGVTLKMLQEVHEVLGAFQRPDGSFDVWALTPEQVRKDMRVRPAAPKVGLVRRTVFEREGRVVGRRAVPA